MKVTHRRALCIFQANSNALSTHENVELQASHHNRGGMARTIAVQSGCGQLFARDFGVRIRKKLDGDVYARKIELARVRWTFRKDERVPGLGSETVCAR